MTLEDMRRRKQELGYSYQEIAQLADMPLTTVQKIMGGVVKSPRRESLLKLERVLGENLTITDGASHVHSTVPTPDVTPTATPHFHYDTVHSPAYVREAVRPYGANPAKTQGDYTTKDYLALPQEARCELIDGVFYDMAAPDSVHQLIVGEVFLQLANHVKGKKGTCLPMLSPFDVQLDCDEKTMVQPDILVLCQPKNQIKNGRGFGAPDFVIEVLSPATARKDERLKLFKYEAAGVREYWLVDPPKSRVIVYDNLQDSLLTTVYTFDDRVPVSIWQRDFSVDFREVKQALALVREDV
ncbi:MAG: Uma2 family endonuclease [Lachnospiraceae bacterium]|nr:Uma2 family endonuclease [Lachnospiraceae bacterium]